MKGISPGIYVEPMDKKLIVYKIAEFYKSMNMVLYIGTLARILNENYIRTNCGKKYKPGKRGISTLVVKTYKWAKKDGLPVDCLVDIFVGHKGQFLAK